MEEVKEEPELADQLIELRERLDVLVALNPSFIQDHLEQKEEQPDVIE